MKMTIHAPLQYIQGPNEITNLCSHYQQISTTNAGAYVIADPYILSVYQTEVTAGFVIGDVRCTLVDFKKQCTQSEVDRLVKAVKEAQADVVIGIGGGKVIDTAKAVAFFLCLPVMLVPTVASTDAPCSALSVLYHQDGSLDRYLPLRRSPDCVIVDTQIIARAPARLLVAGMGDALSTYYEAKACRDALAPSKSGGICSSTVLTLARLCLKTVLKFGEEANHDVKRMQVTEAVERVIEANIYLSGIGFESGGTAAAHAISNALTLQPQTHVAFHGELVAFSTIVQLVLQKTAGIECSELIGFCKKVGLPTTLADIGLAQVQEDQLASIAAVSCRDGNGMENMPFPVTPKQVLEAIKIANAMGSAAQ